MIAHHDPGLSQHNVYILNSMLRRVGNIYRYQVSYFFFFLCEVKLPDSMSVIRSTYGA